MDKACKPEHGSCVRRRRGLPKMTVRQEEDDNDDVTTLMFDRECHEPDVEDDPHDKDYVPFGDCQPKRHRKRRSVEKCAKPTGRASRRRSPQLWVFLLDSLCDPELNPSIIQWVQKSKGIFRLNDTRRIAELWGHRIGKEQKKPMNYEKFSRAIRYYYQHYVILSTEGRLTYQFGPNAKGWKNRSRASSV